MKQCNTRVEVCSYIIQTNDIMYQAKSSMMFSWHSGTRLHDAEVFFEKTLLHHLKLIPLKLCLSTIIAHLIEVPSCTCLAVIQKAVGEQKRLQILANLENCERA